jgi:hypothetical protein
VRRNEERRVEFIRDGLRRGGLLSCHELRQLLLLPIATINEPTDDAFLLLEQFLERLLSLWVVMRLTRFH